MNIKDLKSLFASELRLPTKESPYTYIDATDLEMRLSRLAEIIVTEFEALKNRVEVLEE